MKTKLTNSFHGTESVEDNVTEQSIVGALKASGLEKDKLIEHLMGRVDKLEEELKTAIQWRGCHG